MTITLPARVKDAKQAKDTTGTSSTGIGRLNRAGAIGRPVKPAGGWSGRLIRRALPAGRTTSRGVTGLGGGRWAEVPQPPRWYAASSQLCGFWPFGAGAARPGFGTPLGRDMTVGTAVAGDPIVWRNGFITSETMMIMGLNGYGKSQTALRLLCGAVGIHRKVPMVFDPIKGEHVEAVQALGGTAIRIGPGMTHRINPLDLGSLGEAAKIIGGRTGAELHEQALSKAVDLTTLIVQITRAQPLIDIETIALDLMVRWVIGHNDQPWIGDLVQAFREPPEQVLADLGREEEEFAADFKALRDSVLATSRGEIGDLVGGRQNSIRLDVGNRGGFVFDTSAIPETNVRLLSAAMLSTWSIGFSTMDAHWELSKHDPEKYPWHGYFSMKDELWFPLRAVPGMVDRADRVGRTQRGLELTELDITHGPKDFLSLPNANDRETAKGFIERRAVLGLMAMSRGDLELLAAGGVALNQQEIDTVSRWPESKGWVAPLDKDGRPLPPPGAGKILIKLPERVGIAVQMSITDIERAKHDTDRRH